MSLSETLYGSDFPEQEPAPRPTPLPAVAAPLEADTRIAQLLVGLFAIDKQDLAKTPRGQVIIFRGKLLAEAEQLYPIITEKFRTVGYTAMLERRQGVDILLAIEGLIGQQKVRVRPLIHIALLVATILSTIVVGAQSTGRTFDVIVRNLNNIGIGYLWTVFQAGAPFALTLLTILGVHELGHYFAARRHHVAVTPPFFIPIPLQWSLGTLGAVIFIRSPLQNRKALFDVGISGPLAGFVVAIIAFTVAMFLPANPGFNHFFFTSFGSERIGMPILLQAIGSALRPDDPNLWRFVANQPVALAAWFGIILTVLNLLPVGSLDGGHVMYALFGRAAWVIAFVAYGLIIFWGLSALPSLIIYALLVLLTGLRHPPPNNDITPLNRGRQWLGYATIILFFLIATPLPFPR